MSIQKIHDQFIAGLKQLGLTYEEVKKNWKYCGGNMGSHLSYFNLCFPDLEKPLHKDRCVCNHKIKENCYITEKNNPDNILIIGNCCIKRFIESSGRTCEDCDSPHKNRKINKCNWCKLIKHCETCDKVIDSRYKKCYSCNLIKHCETCDKVIDVKYKKCYKCNLINKNTKTIKKDIDKYDRMNCEQCGKDFEIGDTDLIWTEDEEHICLQCLRLS